MLNLPVLRFCVKWDWLLAVSGQRSASVVRKVTHIGTAEEDKNGRSRDWEIRPTRDLALNFSEEWI